MHTNLVAAAGQAPARAGELVNVAVIVLDRRSLCGDEITGAAVAMQLPLTAEERTVLRGRRRTCRQPVGGLSTTHPCCRQASGGLTAPRHASVRRGETLCKVPQPLRWPHGYR